MSICYPNNSASRLTALLKESKGNDIRITISNFVLENAELYFELKLALAESTFFLRQSIEKQWKIKDQVYAEACINFLIGMLN